MVLCCRSSPAHDAKIMMFSNVADAASKRPHKNWSRSSRQRSNVVWSVSIAGAIMPAYREAGCANGYGILDAPSFIMKLVKDVIE